LKVAKFRERIRERDRACVITGANPAGLFVGVESCHIIPRSHHTWVGLAIVLNNP